MYKLFVEEAGALNDENVDPNKSNDRLQIKNEYQPCDVATQDQSFQSPKLGDKCAAGVSPEVSNKTISNLDFVSHKMTKKSKSMYSREWYMLELSAIIWHGWRGRECANEQKQS